MSQTDFGTKASHAYILCGWHTRSDIPLTGVPGLMRGNDKVDILIQIEPGHPPVAKDLGQGVLEHSGEGWLIKRQGVADFEVIGGRQIRVWPASSATQKDIEIFLFGPVWATLCHQRGLLPLHASAITSNGRIAAFAGHSGVGKSTIAALLSSLSYELVADDVLPVSLNQNSVPGAWPYLRRLKLRDDLATQLKLIPTELVSEKLDKKKYFVHPKYSADDKWRNLDRLYLLETDEIGSSISLERIHGPEAVSALIDQTYHFQFILGSRQFRRHLVFCTQLASKIAVYRLRRSLSTELGKLGDFICAHLEDDRDCCKIHL